MPGQTGIGSPAHSTSDQKLAWLERAVYRIETGANRVFSLSDLDGTLGILEQDGTQHFVKRPIGTATGSSVLTRDQGDARWLSISRLNTANTWALAQTFTVAPVFTDAPGSRTALGVAIGTNVQAWDADLDNLAAPLWRVLTADVTGTDVATAQQWFPTSGAVAVGAATGYFMDGLLAMTRAAGAVSHTTAIAIGGTSSITSIAYMADTTTSTGSALTAVNRLHIVDAGSNVVTAASTSTTEKLVIRIVGVLRTNAAGTVIPQFTFSAAPGGAPTILANSYFRLMKLGTNVVASAGTWT